MSRWLGDLKTESNFKEDQTAEVFLLQGNKAS